MTEQIRHWLKEGFGPWTVVTEEVHASTRAAAGFVKGTPRFPDQDSFVYTRKSDSVVICGRITRTGNPAEEYPGDAAFAGAVNAMA